MADANVPATITIGGHTYPNPAAAGTAVNNPLHELGGFGLDYKPPVHGGYTLPYVGDTPAPLGAETVTDFGTQAYNEGKPGAGYMPGAQWNPINLPPADVYELKQKLLAAGLLNAKTLGNPAVWDQNAAAAYAHVLGFANVYGMNGADAVNYFIANPKMAASTQSTVGQTSPIDINQTYQTVAQNLTGQEEQAPAAFVSQYQGQQVGAQHARGAVYTAPPTVENAAKQYIQTQDPASVQAYGAASRMMDFFSLLGVNK